MVLEEEEAVSDGFRVSDLDDLVDQVAIQLHIKHRKRRSYGSRKGTKALV